MDPTALLSNVTSSISNSLTIAKFVSDLKNTPTDVKTCFDVTSRINADLEYLISLRVKHEKYLLTIPETLNRLDQIIFCARESVLDVCRLLEGCRKEIYEGGRIPFSSKMRWVLGDSAAFTRRTGNLQQQHAALNVEIAFLRQRDLLKPLKRIATTTFENVELLSMIRKKKSRNFENGSIVTVRSVSDFGISTADDSNFEEKAALGATTGLQYPPPPRFNSDLEEIKPLALPVRRITSTSTVSDLAPSTSSTPRSGSSTPFTVPTGISRSISAVSDLDPPTTRSPSFREFTPAASPRGLTEEQISHNGIEETSSYYDGIIPVVSEDREREQAGMEVVEAEEEDPEEAYYRDLRRQEEERLRRMASRRRPG